MNAPLSCAFVLAALFTARPIAASVGESSALPRRVAPAASQLASGPGEVVLVLPFATAAAAQADWLGAGAARYLGEAIRLAGYRVVDEEDRSAVMEERALTELPRLPLATCLVLARELGARYVISGEWKARQAGLGVAVRAVDVEELKLVRELERDAGSYGEALAALAEGILGEAALAPATRRGLGALAEAQEAAVAGWMQAAGEPEQAGLHLRAALDEAPDFEPARLAWAEHLLHQGRAEEAGDALSGLTGSEARHRRSRALALRGRIALALGEGSSAVDSLARAVAELPETGTLLWLAEAQLAAGDPEAAGRTVQQALAQSPADPDALELLTRARDEGAD